VRNLIVPVSGGKDSQVCLSLAMAYCRRHPKTRLVCVHQNTGFDHSKTYRQMKATEKFYGVRIEHTKSRYEGGMLAFLEAAQYFPNPTARGCTQRLKQEPFARWLLKGGYGKHNCEV